MGARVSRAFRRLNLENRVQRELSKDKPSPAPRHAAGEPRAADATPSVTEKNPALLELLRSVYVESMEPPPAEEARKPTANEAGPRRPLKYHLPTKIAGLDQLGDVPQGKLTIMEAVKALGSHQHRPEAWTPERIAQEFCLDPGEAKALLRFFIPFKMEIISPNAAKQVKDS